MNIVYLFLILFTTTLSCAPILLHKTLETPFIQMNEPCYMFSENVFICDDITKAIEYDQDINDDIKNICNQSKIYNFTNDDLSDLTIQGLSLFVPDLVQAGNLLCHHLNQIASEYCDYLII